MSQQFKAGDPALIIGANHNVENIGKQCELVQLVKPGECYYAPDGTHVEYTDTIPAWVVRGDGVSCIFEDGSSVEGWAAVIEKHLMPLRGDFEPEREKARELVQ